MSVLKLALFASLSLVAFGAQHRRAAKSDFEIYAYGPRFGGVGMFYADGLAYIGDPSLSNSTNAATVVFTESDGAFIGSPNTTGLANATVADWSNVTLFVPGPTATDHRVGFLDSDTTANSSVIADRFFFYGQTAMVKDSAGAPETLWTGLQVGSTGVYAVYWNDTSLGQVHLTMRSIGPSNPGSVPAPPTTTA